MHLATVRGRPHSPAVGALVREAMRVKWFGEPVIVSRPREIAAGAKALPAAGRKPQRVAVE